MTDKAISPLRQRLIEDMAIRRLGPTTQHDYIRHVIFSLTFSSCCANGGAWSARRAGCLPVSPGCFRATAGGIRAHASSTGSFAWPRHAPVTAASHTARSLLTRVTQACGPHRAPALEIAVSGPSSPRVE